MSGVTTTKSPEVELTEYEREGLKLFARFLVRMYLAEHEPAADTARFPPVEPTQIDLDVARGPKAPLGPMTEDEP